MPPATAREAVAAVETHHGDAPVGPRLFSILQTELTHRLCRHSGTLAQFVKIEKSLGPDGRIAVVRFDRGDGLNALSPEALRQLTDPPAVLRMIARPRPWC